MHARASLSGELADARKGIAERDQELDQLRNDLAIAHVALTERDHTIREIFNSTSWQVTGPLRAVKRTMLGLKNVPTLGRRLLGRTARAFQGGTRTTAQPCAIKSLRSSRGSGLAGPQPP